MTEAGESGRIVSVVTPIYGGQGCDASGCHADTGFSFIPGFLEADYSLRRVDDLIISRFFYTALALLVSLVLCVAATWWIVDRLVGRRIKTLREGAERVARKDFSFRFHDATGDGIAELSGTFDTMVSELSATLTELTETKEYLEGIVESSADVIITVDPSGLINTFNTGAEAVLGYEREEVVGKRIEILFADPTERDVAIERLSRTDHVVNYETHFLTKSGDVRDVILTLSRLRTPDGVPVGTFGISKDVTEEKRLQREVISKARLAAVGEAVTGMHHTLKNMLGALRGGSYMVNLGLEEDDRDLLGEGWKMVQEGIGHVTGLSSEMLEYVREWGPRLEECDLGDLLASVHRSGLNLARGKGIEVRVVVGLDSPTIKCDPKLIRSALMDLVVNAIEACEWKDYRGGEAPEVVLSACCSEDGQRVLLEVWDNGQGITDEIIENLFDPFFSTKRSTGTGMGLALASRVVRAHAGTIHVESEPNRGSTFRISIPVGTQQERKEKQNAQESSSY
ncbi:MAG: PAS domain S-box protein [Gemmatimonadetes bacterium]|nr:PAS domain S-box protein [Gemmatimonadota bacterium]